MRARNPIRIVRALALLLAAGAARPTVAAPAQ